MAFKSSKEVPKKKKFAGGLAFMAFYIVVACLIYLPWERYLPLAPPPDPNMAPVAEPAAAPPPPTTSPITRFCGNSSAAPFWKTSTSGPRRRPTRLTPAVRPDHECLRAQPHGQRR